MPPSVMRCVPGVTGAKKPRADEELVDRAEREARLGVQHARRRVEREDAVRQDRRGDAVRRALPGATSRRTSGPGRARARPGPSPPRSPPSGSRGPDGAGVPSPRGGARTSGSTSAERAPHEHGRLVYGRCPRGQTRFNSDRVARSRDLKESVARQPIRMLATGAAYVLVYVCLTLFGPPLGAHRAPAGGPAGDRVTRARFGPAGPARGARLAGGRADLLDAVRARLQRPRAEPRDLPGSGAAPAAGRRADAAGPPRLLRVLRTVARGLQRAPGPPALVAPRRHGGGRMDDGPRGLLLPALLLRRCPGSRRPQRLADGVHAAGGAARRPRPCGSRR